MTTEIYNGWANYATWGVVLVLGNDEGTYAEVTERARELQEQAPGHHNVPEIWTAEQAARFELTDWLKSYVEQLCGLEGEAPEPSLMARQIIAAGLADVDWDEVADHYLEA